MFESIIKFFKKVVKSEEKKENTSKDMAKERLHLVLMQDRANVSADFLEMMKQEILEVIKKYIEIDEKEIDVHLTNKVQDDGTNGAPFLYANIPILNIKNDMKKEKHKNKEQNTVTDNEKELSQEDDNKKEEINTNKEIEQEIEKKEEILEEKNEVIDSNNEQKEEVVETETKEAKEEVKEDNVKKTTKSNVKTKKS